jgi:Ferritin-like domain
MLEPLKNSVSRRGLITASAFTGIGLALSVDQVSAMTGSKNADKSNDIKVLNNGLYYEHQAIWAYQFAAGKLSSNDIGKAVLAVASDNLRDHQAHRHTGSGHS